MLQAKSPKKILKQENSEDEITSCKNSKPSSIKPVVSIVLIIIINRLILRSSITNTAKYIPECEFELSNFAPKTIDGFCTNKRRPAKEKNFIKGNSSFSTPSSLFLTRCHSFYSCARLSNSALTFSHFCLCRWKIEQKKKKNHFCTHHSLTHTHVKFFKDNKNNDEIGVLDMDESMATRSKRR